jgi:hypothetical protein
MQVGAASTDEAEHLLQATLVTVNDFDRDSGPWRWGGSLDVDEYSPGDYTIATSSSEVHSLEFEHAK